MIPLREVIASLLVVSLLIYLTLRYQRPSDRATTGAHRYRFSASTGIRSEKTTYLEFAAPSPPNSERHSRPAILEVFDCSTAVRSRLVKRHRHEQPSGDSADGVSACPAEPSIRTPASSHVYPPSYATKPKPKPNVLRIEPHLADPQHITGDSATRLTRSSSTRSVVDPPTISGTSSSDVDDPPPTAGPSRRNVDHPSAGPPSHDIVTRRPVAGKAKLPKYDRQDKTHGGWAGSEGRGPIAAPPIFQNENDIRLGDVYHHQVPDDFQLWLRVLGEEGPYWLSVPAGYIRESDGRYLSVTQQKLEPSWITSIEWCNKCIRAVKRRTRE